MSGQTLTDRIAAAQYQLTGSDMARAVCKATTHEVMAPKKKHLECKWSPSFSLMSHTPQTFLSLFLTQGLTGCTHTHTHTSLEHVPSQP